MRDSFSFFNNKIVLEINLDTLILRRHYDEFVQTYLTEVNAGIHIKKYKNNSAICMSYCITFRLRILIFFLEATDLVCGGFFV